MNEQMSSREVLKIAKEIAGNEADVSLHQGWSKRDRGIRITGCWPETARRVGAQIAYRIGGDLRVDAGFVCVWL